VRVRADKLSALRSVFSTLPGPYRLIDIRQNSTTIRLTTQRDYDKLNCLEITAD
jgi:hypothetical protein